MEEGQKAKALYKPSLPSAQEIDQHNVSHLPYRSWCPHCVKGKRKGKAHFRKKVKEEEERLSTVHGDYFFFDRRGRRGPDRTNSGAGR